MYTELFLDFASGGGICVSAPGQIHYGFILPFANIRQQCNHKEIDLGGARSFSARDALSLDKTFPHSESATLRSNGCN
jgi:hypothetical protein